MNPFENNGVSQYMKRLKDDQASANILVTSTSVKSTHSVPYHSKSPFTKFAEEIILEILLHLPYQDLQNFVLVGLTTIKLSEAQGYWKRKIAIDLPFLWDLPDLDGPRDFFKIYHELRRQCFATTPLTGEDDEGTTRVQGPRDKTLVLGLANRRRVWNTCARLAESYVEEQNAGKDSSDVRDTTEELVKNRLSLSMPLVASPVSKEFRPLSTYFISSWDDLEKGTLFAFYFNDSSRLCGLEVLTVGTNDSRLLGEKPSRAGSGVKVKVPAGDWINCFDLNIGNCQYLDKDAVIGITGLKVVLTAACLTTLTHMF